MKEGIFGTNWEQWVAPVENKAYFHTFTFPYPALTTTKRAWFTGNVIEGGNSLIHIWLVCTVRIHWFVQLLNWWHPRVTSAHVIEKCSNTISFSLLHLSIWLQHGGSVCVVTHAWEPINIWIIIIPLLRSRPADCTETKEKYQAAESVFVLRFWSSESCCWSESFPLKCPLLFVTVGSGGWTLHCSGSSDFTGLAGCKLHSVPRQTQVMS